MAFSVLLALRFASAITSTDLELLKTDIQVLIPQSPNSTRANTIGAMVRLPFHDALGSGTMQDGCLAPNNKDHNGLEHIREVLDPVCQMHAAQLSRADCWAVAGNVAIAQAGGPEVSFRFGRKDCVDESQVTDSVNGESLLPSAMPAGNPWLHIKAVFVTRGTLSVRDIVALIGAHSLGQVASHPSNSGFSSLPWNPHHNTVLSNNFFLDIGRMPWIRQKNGEWTNNQSEPSAIRLDTDMGLVIDTTQCTWNEQGQLAFGRTFDTICEFNVEPKYYVDEFIFSNDFFLKAFGVAMQKLEEIGYTKFQGSSSADWVTTLCEVTPDSTAKECLAGLGDR